MALKRKRSSPTISSPSSDASEATAQSSPMPFFYLQSKPVEPLVHKPTWSFPTYDDHSSRHLNSRTRKRYRDNRPDEQLIYSNTINRLYQAQRQHPNAEPVISETNAKIQINPAETQRSTLHAFWRLPTAPKSTPISLDSRRIAGANISCEDCDKPLKHDDAMDVDEYILEEEMGCHYCKRAICDICAVVGDLRICLSCVNSKEC